MCLSHLQEYIEGWLCRSGDPGYEDGADVNDEHEDNENVDNVIFDHNFEDYDYHNIYDGIIKEPVDTDDDVDGNNKNYLMASSALFTFLTKPE